MTQPPPDGHPGRPPQGGFATPPPMRPPTPPQRLAPVLPPPILPPPMEPTPPGQPEPMVAVAAVTPPAVGGGLRGERRAERRRRRRRNRALIALALVVVLAAVAAGVALVGRHPEHHRAPVAGRGQQTLLLGIGPVSGAAASVALYGVSASGGQGATLLIPPDTLVDGPGTIVGGSFPIVPTSEFAGAVSDLLGVHVDATWRLTQAGLASIVDQLGGVRVNVDTAISAGGLSLSPGPQTLGGDQAAAYALYGGDTEQARANRTRLVLDAVLAKLPSRPSLTALLGALGQGSSSTLTAPQLASFLLQLAHSDDADNEQLLPVTTLDAGASTPTFAFDEAAAKPIVSSLFAGSLIAGGGAVGTRVEIIDDSGRPDLATGPRAQLTAAGLSFVRAVNDQPFHQYKRSSILVFSSSPASIEFGHRVATALGIPDAPVLVSSQTSSVADALAVLDADYPG